MERTICEITRHGKYQRHYHSQHLPTALWQQLQENIDFFTSELDPLISSFDTSTNNLIAMGDFKINLLLVDKCNKEHYGDFLDLMLGHSLFLKITLPTRTAESSCSLFDNIFTTLSPNFASSQSGIIYSRISDHHPYFLSICPSNKISVGMNKKDLSNRGLIARLLTIISNIRCLKTIYQLPWILTPIAIQILTTIFYTIIWRRWKTNIYHIDMENLTNIDTGETNGQLMLL